MADTVYTDGVSLLTADTMNDLNRLHYTILGDPADAAAVRSIIDTRSTVASATTPDIWTSTGHIINYTGTTTSTGLAAAPQAGAQRLLIAAGASLLTHGANYILPGSVNYTTVAGDKILVDAITTTQFRLTIWKADGTPSVPVSIFSAYASGTLSNVTGDATDYAVIFDTEIADRGANYNNATGVFTAPATGLYRFAVNLTLRSLGAAHTSGFIQIVTTGRTVTVSDCNVGASRDATSNFYVGGGTALLSMTAGNGAFINVQVANGTKVVGVDGQFDGSIVAP